MLFENQYEDEEHYREKCEAPHTLSDLGYFLEYFLVVHGFILSLA